MQTIQQSITEIEDMFTDLICRILKIDPDNINGRIRCVWGSDVDSKSMSAPNLKTTEDVCYITITPKDDAYDRQREIRYLNDRSSADMFAVDEHTDVYQVVFTSYGLGAFDCARAIRDGLFHRNTRRFLRLNRWALITDVAAIRRAPELVNAQWVNRVDVSADFNSLVRLVDTIGTIERVGITIKQENGNERTFETNRKE